jgi:hypothetical protein
VSASDPEGINLGYIGAWNENVRREDGRVFLDKVIDVEVANRSDGGKAVLAAIEKGEAVHTSTGLLCTLETANGSQDHKHVARNMVFDHDAILLGGAGAATPEQGVGMLVNAKGEEEEIQVINSSLTDAADQEIDWAGTRLIEALRRRENIGIWDKVKTAIMDAIGSGREPSTNRKEDDMPVSDEQFKSLSDEVKTLSEGFGKIGETIANAVTTALKPVLDQQAELVANQKAKDDAEHADLVAKVVKANVLDEATAKATPLNTLRALAPKQLSLARQQRSTAHSRAATASLPSSFRRETNPWPVSTKSMPARSLRLRRRCRNAICTTAVLPGTALVESGANFAQAGATP